MPLPVRKPNRLKNYDYSTPNIYFITICTADRKCIFWDNQNNVLLSPHDVQLSHYGKIVQQAANEIPAHYPFVSVKHYAIMPNHVHFLLQLEVSASTNNIGTTSISTVIKEFKRIVSRKAGFSIWQKGFHDHIIRGENDYLEIWKYIDENPIKWELDHLFAEI